MAAAGSTDLVHVGNAWRGIEFEFNDEQTATGWRDVELGDNSKEWNRDNVVYVKQNDSWDRQRLVPKNAKQYE